MMHGQTKIKNTSVLQNVAMSSHRSTNTAYDFLATMTKL